MMSKGYAWIITDGITSILNSMDPQSLTQCKVWALARASEEISPRKSQPEKLKSLSKFTNLASISVSQTGSKILKAVLQSKYNGLSGKFQLKDGQLEPVAFQLPALFNICERSCTYHLAGLSAVTPKGWTMPVSGKKLRIGVPVKEGFTELVKVDHDLQTGAVSVSGFCIDVFKAAVENLPYALTYEFIPFDNSNGSSAATYSDLVFQVYLQNAKSMMSLRVQGLNKLE
ncbi:Glutamate receptor 2.3 [Vitis vinifera]|uniref:Glutamate receptor 2.3 n=1 Tax=Vitis vinifera TaxID=29760 RepID=A0A438CXT4_VITVI|nr:Glutamate receptor 2.3 [Vitis vinifera]